MKTEFRVVHAKFADDNDAASFEAQLNELAAAGWHLLHVLSSSTNDIVAVFHLKREEAV